MSAKITKYVDAISVTGFNTSIFGRPKLTIVCGHCETLFKTRDYVPITNVGNLLAANCSSCGYWNNTKLVYS